ncbi:MAG: helix-turn-helix domain-containing protein [Spirochaetales bacterium]|nr:helix-turn-helix domain-containing protein [Spirochaetales bacterium]
MIKNRVKTQILLISTAVILVLSVFIIISGMRSFTYNRLSIEALAVMDTWNGLERMKNDFLMNRSTVNVSGEFEYKENVKRWNGQIDEFEILFNNFLANSSKVSSYDTNLTNLKDASIIWDSTYKNLLRIHEILEQIEKAGLDTLLFPELINNFYIYRMSDKIDFHESILVMNLLNQFAFLDISSKEFSRLINSFVTELQYKHEINFQRLTFISSVILFLLILSIVFMAFSFKKLSLSDQNIDNYQREEKYKALRRFIKGHENWSNIENRFSTIDISKISEKSVIPVLLKFNNYRITINSYGPTEIYSQLAILSRQLEQHLSEFLLNSIVIPFEEGLVVYHILKGDLLSESEEDRTLRLINTIKQIIENNNLFSFSYTYGAVHQFPSQTQESFRELSEAAYYKILFGYNTIISVEKMRPQNKIGSNYPVQLENQLTEYIKQGKIDNAKKIYSQIMTKFTSSNYTVIKNGINRLVIVITSALDTLEKFNNLGDVIDTIDFTQKIHSMETIDEINTAIFNLIDNIAFELSEKKDSYKYNQISEVNKIIQRDYSNPNLSAGSISENLGLSTAYIGRVFKNQTGESIQETINQKRVDTAKELLLQEKSTIAEICDAVGIVNHMYFYTLFKKKFGTTPKDYRQQIMHKE